MTLGIEYKHSRPYHPQTCGKVERFHQTLKKHLASQPKARTIAELQVQIDRFAVSYNTVRPHRAKGRRPPRQAFDARAKGVRVRQDRVDKSGKVTLRHAGTLHHIGVGRDHKQRRVIMLIAGLDIRVITRDGELLRHLTLDPSKTYQETGRPPGPPKGRPLGPRKKKRASTMSRDICPRCPVTSDFEACRNSELVEIRSLSEFGACRSSELDRAKTGPRTITVSTPAENWCGLQSRRRALMS